METTLLIQLAILMALIGGFAGIIAGLLGVGGGIVLVPAFYYGFSALGHEGPELMQVCLATSLATIVVTSARSVMLHKKTGKVDTAILYGWSPGIVIGAMAGVLAATELESRFLTGLFGALGVIVSLYLGLGKDSWRVGPQMPKGLARAIMSPVLGFLSVLMGIGGGSFGVPLMSLYGVAIHRAVATAAGFGAAIAMPAALGFVLWKPQFPESIPPLTIGFVNMPAFALVIAMTLMTTPLGVRLSHSTNPRPLRKIFAVFLGIVALNMIRKAWMT